MTLLLRALLLGYGSAVLGAVWLQGWTGIWAALLGAWVGGGVLSLVFAGIGARLRPVSQGTLPAGTAELRISRAQRERAPGHATPAGNSPHAMPERHARVRLTLS